jgi:hypothetical protein
MLLPWLQDEYYSTQSILAYRVCTDKWWHLKIDAPFQRNMDGSTLVSLARRLQAQLTTTVDGVHRTIAYDFGPISVPNTSFGWNQFGEDIAERLPEVFDWAENLMLTPMEQLAWSLKNQPVAVGDELSTAGDVPSAVGE